MATASTLRTYPVGGQLDPAWLAASIPWTEVRATACLQVPTGTGPAVDPTNGAHESPTTVARTLTADAADGMWATAPLKPVTGLDADLALQPSGCVWSVTVEIKRGATWHTVATYTVAPSGDRNYSGLGELTTIAGDDTIDINALLPPPLTAPPSDAFEQAVLEVLANNPGSGGGGGAAYLHTQSPAASTWTVNHNLGVLTPDVTLADAAGLEFMGDIDYVTINQLLIINAAPIAGTAYIQA